MSEQRNSQTMYATAEVSAVGELAKQAALAPSVVSITSPDGCQGQFVQIPVIADGKLTVRLDSVTRFYDEYRTRPAQRKGTATLGDLASLIKHVNRFKDTDSVVFADTDRNNPTITAVLDYHKAGSSSDPRFGYHRSHYEFPVSDEWKAWTGASGREMSQGSFAEFIESRIVDVVEFSPEFKSAQAFAEKCGITFATPAQVMELSRGLSITVDSKLATTVNLQNGIRQIQFSENHVGDNGTALKVPGAFLVGIPAFRGEARYQVCVRLRYRKSGATLNWIMDLWRHEEVFDAAIRDACEKVEQATGLPLLYGNPE